VSVRRRRLAVRRLVWERATKGRCAETGRNADDDDDDDDDGDDLARRVEGECPASVAALASLDPPMSPPEGGGPVWSEDREDENPESPPPLLDRSAYGWWGWLAQPCVHSGPNQEGRRRGGGGMVVVLNGEQ